MEQDTSPVSQVPQSPSREQFWREILQQFAASGCSVRQFSAARGVSQPAFYAWRRRLAPRDAQASPPSRVPPRFLPVCISPEPHAPIEILLPGQRLIGLCGPVNRTDLLHVLAALQSLS